MAQLGQAFDSGQHDDMNNFDPIPAGEYAVKIVDSDIKKTAAKTGKYIKFEFEVIKGDFKGRKIWTNLNIVNPSPVAVEIAQKELATICRAVGKAVIQDTQQLHGIPFLMKVRIKPAKGDYPAGNAPTGYKPIGTVGGFDPSEETDGKKAAENFTKESGAAEDDDPPWGDE